MVKVHLLVLFVFLSVWMVTSAYRYLGCYEDQYDSILTNFTLYDDDMTVEKCIQKCSIQGYYFAGTKHSRYCYCGHDLARNEQYNDDECTSVCVGNRSQSCGGGYKISVYDTNNYLGCYSDGQNRILEGPVIRSEQMTTDYCLSYCQSVGARLALTEASIYCFCGNQKYDVYPKVDDSQCDADCAMQNGEKCGGYWRGSLYLVP